AEVVQNIGTVLDLQQRRYHRDRNLKRRVLRDLREVRVSRQRLGAALLPRLRLALRLLHYRRIVAGLFLGVPLGGLALLDLCRRDPRRMTGRPLDQRRIVGIWIGEIIASGTGFWGGRRSRFGLRLDRLLRGLRKRLQGRNRAVGTLASLAGALFGQSIASS